MSTAGVLVKNCSGALVCTDKYYTLCCCMVHVCMCVIPCNLSVGQRIIYKTRSQFITVHNDQGSAQKNALKYYVASREDL